MRTIAPLGDVIPGPAQWRAGPGHIPLSALEAVSVGEPALLGVAERFRADAAAYLGLQLSTSLVEATATAGSIRLDIGTAEGSSRATRGIRADGAPADVERHHLTITDSGIRVVGVSEEAVQRGLTTLVHLASSGAGTLQCGAVDDAPEFAWRGLSLDVVRWFVPVEELKRVIDVLALYKLNVLHLHLTDNEGWRLEIDGRPGLTECSPDGSYTQAEFCDLVAYATERFVTIVPEIDLPGHAATVLAAYPHLGVAVPPDEASPLRIAHLDPSVEETWDFVDDVIGQVAGISPAPYVHLGGDEAFGMEAAAYLDFIDRAIAVARRHGKRVVGWQETCRAGVGAEEVIQHWIDFAGLEDRGSAPSAVDQIPADALQTLAEHFLEGLGDLGRIAEKGARLLLSPTSTFYLDQPHGDASIDPDQEADRSRLGLQLYPARSLEAMLAFDLEAATPGFDEEALAGVEAALWCETVRSAEDLELLLLPRVAGVAELGWNTTAPADWVTHRQRLAGQPVLWERAGWSWYRAASVDWQ